MSYNPYYAGGWQSGEGGNTPISPEALNHFDEGIKDAHQAAAACLPKAGGYMQGPLVLLGNLILTEGVHYGSEAPASGEEGQLFLVEIAE